MKIRNLFKLFEGTKKNQKQTNKQTTPPPPPPPPKNPDPNISKQRHHLKPEIPPPVQTP